MGLLILLALGLLAGGIALKIDPATAAIVTGALLLVDIELTSMLAFRRGRK